MKPNTRAIFDRALADGLVRGLSNLLMKQAGRRLGIYLGDMDGDDERFSAVAARRKVVEDFVDMVVIKERESDALGEIQDCIWSELDTYFDFDEEDLS